MGKGAAGTGIEQRVTEARRSHGWSQADLARAAGLTRQAVNAIESSRYVPNTTVALRLAHALGRRVDDLFALSDSERPRPVWFAGPVPAGGDRAAVGVVRGRLIAHPLDGSRGLMEGFAPAEGIIEGATPVGRRRSSPGSVRLLVPRGQLDRTALLLGCDPSLGILAAHVARRHDGTRLSWVQATSGRALRAIEDGEAHAAGTHLWDQDAGDYNIGPARGALRRTGGLLVCLAAWEQGFVVAAGNPKAIRGAADLARSDVRIMNREPGAGARELLDRLLTEAGVSTAAVAGYEQTASGHVAVARAVAGGSADAGVALRAVADAHGLGFVPITQVRFDLAIPEDQTGHPAIEAVLDTLNAGSFRAELRSLSGYETSRSGGTVLEVKPAA